jgi:hypothetical protein
MGTTKVTNTSQNTSSKATATAEEIEMQKAQLAQFKGYEPGQTEMYKSAFALGNQLLTSFGDKEGDMWKALIGGVTDKQSRSMINSQDQTLRGSFQQQGIYDSGTAASSRMRAGADLANQNAQFNVGALQNALNLAMSGQAQIQAPAQGATNSLSQSLQGLRSITGKSTGMTTMPYFGQNLGIFGTWGSSNCWVAAELFGGWNEPKTEQARFFINFLAPKWFLKFYSKYGESIAKFIHNKPLLKMALKPLFEVFAYLGKKKIEQAILEGAL